MKTEEIDKAGKRYAYNIIPNENGMTFPVERSELSKAFKEGVQFSDKHWQEKTRWIPVEERLPPRGTETRQVFVKNKNKHHLNWMMVSCFDDDYLNDIEFIKGEFTHWKEID